MRFHAYLLAMIAATIPLYTYASGTVPFGTVERLIKTRSSFLEQLKYKYQLPDKAFAEVTLGREYVHLAGTNVGPYFFMVHANPKVGIAVREIVVCTDIQFLDGEGKALAAANALEAKRYQERVVNVYDRPAEFGARSPCN